MSRYMVVDTETTGLDHNIHGIITLSAIVYDGENIVCGWNGANGDWENRFKIDLSALKVNGFKLRTSTDFFAGVYRGNNKVSYIKYQTYQEFVSNFVDFMLNETSQCEYLMGMNLQFDLGFIHKALTDLHINANGFLPRKHIDPRVIACALQDCNKLPETLKNINSENLYKNYKIEAPSTLHKSDTDVFMTHKLWMEMKKTFSVKT